MKQFSNIFIILFSVSSAFAEMAPVAKATPTPTPKQPVQAGPPAYTPIAAPNPSKTEGLENNGQLASQKQGQGGAAAAAALAAMTATMAATCPACAIRGTCPTCIASTIGAAASGLTGSNMDKAQGLSNGQVNAVNPTATPGVKKGFVNSTAYQAAMKDLEKATNGTGVGISKDFKTITTPDGRTIDAAKALSGGGGLSGGELSMLKDQMKKAADAAAKVTGAPVMPNVNAQDGEGTGAASTASSSGADDSERQGGGVAVARSRAPANIAGATKDLNGDPIGVGVDSLFEMMHRRYRASSDRQMFIPQER